MNSKSDLKNLLGEQDCSIKPRKRLAEDATDSLRQLILLGTIKPGASIAEREIASALGISRTPLREAMRQLEIEGLIEYSSTRRPRVADPDIDELHQYLVVLGTLEGLAGELACRSANDRQIEQIDKLNDQMQQRSDSAEPMEFFELDMQFHQLIVAASANPPLEKTHRNYNARLWRARYISSIRKSNRKETLEQHEQIAAALRRRDIQASTEHSRLHMEQAVINLETVMAEKPHCEKGG